MKFLITVAVNTIALWVAVYLLDGLDFSGEWWQWLILGLIFGVVNAIVKPIAKILTLPLTIITFGLFLFVLNAVMLLLTSWLSGIVLSGVHDHIACGRHPGSDHHRGGRDGPELRAGTDRGQLSASRTSRPSRHR